MEIIANMIKSMSYFTIESSEDDYLLLSSKNNSNESFHSVGKEDIKEAIRIKNYLINNFKNLIIDVDVCGAWVNLHVFKN